MPDHYYIGLAVTHLHMLFYLFSVLCVCNYMQLVIKPNMAHQQTHGHLLMTLGQSHLQYFPALLRQAHCPGFHRQTATHLPRKLSPSRLAHLERPVNQENAWKGNCFPQERSHAQQQKLMWPCQFHPFQPKKNGHRLTHQHAGFLSCALWSAPPHLCAVHHPKQNGFPSSKAHRPLLQRKPTYMQRRPKQNNLSPNHHSHAQPKQLYQHHHRHHPTRKKREHPHLQPVQRLMPLHLHLPLWGKLWLRHRQDCRTKPKIRLPQPKLPAPSSPPSNPQLPKQALQAPLLLKTW